MNARAIPVFPLVGSMISVSGVSCPALAAASIMARPIRSLTLDNGLKNSSLTNTDACPRGMIRFRRTKGVLKTVWTISR